MRPRKVVLFLPALPSRRSPCFSAHFEPIVVGYHIYPRSTKSSPMRASVAIRATGSSAISRRQTLARILQAQPGLALISVMVSRSVWDREGGGSSPPWVTIFRFPSMGKARYCSDHPTDRIAGYDPANEGSNPSLNTISSRRSRVTIYGIHTLSIAPCSFLASIGAPILIRT